MKDKSRSIIRSFIGGLVLGCAACLTLPAATLMVTSTADSGSGTLRAALATAADGDVINFSLTTPAKITLTSGELLINSSVAIMGPGPANLAVDGNFPSRTNRVFHIAADKSVIISSLTVTNGSAQGLDDFGGGIYNQGQLIMSNCTVSGNSASSDGGGYGGAIYNDGYQGNGLLTLNNCTVSSNSASGGGFGGAIYNEGYQGMALLTLNNSTVSSNSASGNGGGFGGAIYNDGFQGYAVLTLSNSAVNGNSASDTDGGFGGAIYNDARLSGSATLQVVGSTINGNSAFGDGGGYGGGIFIDADDSGNAMLQVTNSTFSGNSASGSSGGFGGAIYNSEGFYGSATLQVAGSTLSGNSASGDSGGYGGGIYNGLGQSGNATAQIANSTLSGNSASGAGGGLGGACYNDNSTLTLSNSTLSANSADSGGGIYNDGSLDSATLMIANAILDGGIVGENIYNDSGVVASEGYNLSSDNGSGYLTATGDKTNTDPMLGPLANYGGSTLTHALRQGSPAIDAGNPSLSVPPAFDQRGPGFPRVQGGRIDIGAYESSDLRIVASGKTGTALQLSFASLLGAGYEVVSRTNLAGVTWTPLAGTTLGNGGIALTTISNAFGLPRQFFGIHELP